MGVEMGVEGKLKRRQERGRNNYGVKWGCREREMKKAKRQHKEDLSEGVEGVGGRNRKINEKRKAGRSVRVYKRVVEGEGNEGNGQR